MAVVAVDGFRFVSPDQPKEAFVAGDLVLLLYRPSLVTAPAGLPRRRLTLPFRLRAPALPLSADAGV